MEESKRGQTIWNDCGASLGSGFDDFDNQMATFHFLGELGSKPGPLWKMSPDGSAIPPPPQNLAPKK
jgi:hypothetical protein